LTDIIVFLEKAMNAVVACDYLDRFDDRLGKVHSGATETVSKSHITNYVTIDVLSVKRV